MKRLSQLLLATLRASLFFSACKKDKVASKSALSPSDSTNPDALVAIPAGLMPRSYIHLIKSGYALMYPGGHMYKVERASRNIIEDFGVMHRGTSTSTPSTTPIKTITTTSGNSGLPTSSVDQDNS